MSTIAAGQVFGLSRSTALDFSFLVSLPVMFAACGSPKKPVPTVIPAAATTATTNTAAGATSGRRRNTHAMATGASGAASTSATAIASPASITGTPVRLVGDIPAAQTHVAAARTLGVAVGIPSSQLAGDFISSAGGKVVNAALNGVSG